MEPFHLDNRVLYCDGVNLESLADAVGTPFYVYSASFIKHRYTQLDAAFTGASHALHYALKANSTLAIVRLLRSLGAAVDANSGGEIEVALRAGFIPSQIVFTGVGKTLDELDRAVSLELKTINVESPGEIERIDRIAREQGTRTRIALRVNPDVDAGTHRHISTGLKRNKFGVPLASARALARDAAARPGLQLVGLHVHVGSQIVSLEPLRRAAETAASLALDLKSDGIGLEHLDLGGGLGVSYDGAEVPSLEDYARTLIDSARPTGLSLVIEPGRSIVAPSGALITRVVDVKQHSGDRTFVIVDAGMTELLRPALYEAYHRIIPVRAVDAPEIVSDIVGPVCESSDTFGVDRRLPLPRVGDCLAVVDAGAYGVVMASNYNRRPLPSEVLVEDDTWRLIRRRQTVDDMLAFEC